MTGPGFDPTIAAARLGADWAWAALYDELAPPILGYLKARGATDPEDLLGEVFLHAVRNLGRFEGDEASFRTWVFTIAHHRLVDDRRARARRPPTAELSALSEVASTMDVHLDVTAKIEVSKLLNALRSLPPRQQEVLLLRLLADLTIEEIARVLGKRVGAVKALQRRGLTSLREKLG